MENVTLLIIYCQTASFQNEAVRTESLWCRLI